MGGTVARGGQGGVPVSAVPRNTLASLEDCLATSAYTSGSTHQFYHYPARFHPTVAREFIRGFSRPGDWVLDPFMGGGTSVIEGLALGRRVIGTDINTLARFIADVRTRPLSPADENAVRGWADRASRALGGSDVGWVSRTRVRNLPGATELFLSGALALSGVLERRRRNFARAALLRLGQWALDCRDFKAPRRSRLAERLPELVDEMLIGLAEFVSSCREVGTRKREIAGRRVLLHSSAVDLHETLRPRTLCGRPRLVFTSPPYPGVHVLYHRWQYQGRRETPAPYWIANVLDGSGPSFYCGGSRTPTGLANYFRMIEAAFSSVARVLHPKGVVVQIVGFSDVAQQFPMYLAAMERAGFREVSIAGVGETRLERQVANRKWYAKLKGDIDASTEFLLVHRRR
jgi:hypothetical protein